ncbi:hypothetical protein HMSSN139_66080 [Paenibacillus sp. HMSSN-139]|nr:hypothetical protein HMSSN139_66080 [Paenibacillus sp. HMSSN-139]
MPRDITNEDQSYVKLYIMLPMILSAFERDKKLAEQTFKTPRPYVTLIGNAIKRVEDDCREVRRMFRLHGLKVYEERRTESGIHARYLCRGYHHEITLLWPLVKAESSVLMEKYLGLDIFKYINPSVHGAEHDFDVPSDKVTTLE